MWCPNTVFTSGLDATVVKKKKKKKRNTFLLSSEENQLNTNQIIKTKFIQFVSIIEQKTIREVAC